MPERGPSGATISRGPSLGGARAGGGERGFSSVISGGPRVSITRSIGATRVPVEGRLGVPLRPISFPQNAGERQATSFSRSRLPNITARPRATGGNFIRGLGEFKAAASPQTRRLPQTRTLGEIGHMIDQTGGTARNTNVNNLRRQSEPVLVPGGGTSGPELRANTVSIVPFRNNRAFENGRTVQSPRVPEIGNRPQQSVENTPPITVGRVLGSEIQRAVLVEAKRNTPDRKHRTARAIGRIREQLRQVVTVSRVTSGDEIAPAVRFAALSQKIRPVTTKEVQASGGQARDKLLVRQAKIAGVSVDSDKTLNPSLAIKNISKRILRVWSFNGDNSNPQWNVLHTITNTKFIKAFEAHLRGKSDPNMWRKFMTLTMATPRVRSSESLDAIALLEEEERKKKKVKSLDQVIPTKPAEQDAVQTEHLIAEAVDTVARLDMQPIGAPTKQPLAQPLGVGVLEETKPDTAVKTVTDTIITAAAVQPQASAQAVEQKSAAPDVLPQQKSDPQPKNNFKTKNRPSHEPEQAKGNYIISRPTQNHRVNAGRNGIWLSFAGTAQEKIEAEAILTQVQKPNLQTTSPVLVAVGAGQAVESGIADPTDQAWREDFASRGLLTRGQAEEALVFDVEKHQAIARGPGNPRASKEQVEEVLGNVPREDETANLPL